MSLLCDRAKNKLDKSKRKYKDKKTPPEFLAYHHLGAAE